MSEDQIKTELISPMLEINNTSELDVLSDKYYHRIQIWSEKLIGKYVKLPGKIYLNDKDSEKLDIEYRIFKIEQLNKWETAFSAYFKISNFIYVNKIENEYKIQKEINNYLISNVRRCIILEEADIQKMILELKQNLNNWIK